MEPIQIQHMDLKQIANSGQCFFWNKIEDNKYGIEAFGRYLEAEQNGSQFLFSCTRQEFEGLWADYFDLGRDYGALKERIDPEDGYLQAAARYGGGIRVLRQDLWEVAVSFLISQNNNISRIKASLRRLCRSYGERRPCLGAGSDGEKAAAESLREAAAGRAADGGDMTERETAAGRAADGGDMTEREAAAGRAADGGGMTEREAAAGRAVGGSGWGEALYYTFPGPDRLAMASVEELKELGLGYRAKYLAALANRLKKGGLFRLNQALREAGDEEAREILMSYYGIGRKVADCICLFGLQREDMFPVDTHIKKILAAHYPRGFPYERYRGSLGILQQYMFYYDLMGGPPPEEPPR